MTKQERLLRSIQLLAIGVLLFISLSWAQANVSGLGGGEDINYPWTLQQWFILGIYWITMCLPFVLILGVFVIIVMFLKK